MSNAKASDNYVEENIKHILKDLPDLPGIYQMIDNQGVVIYIGKAKNLKRRVNSYFNKLNVLDIKTYLMVQQIKNVETIITNTEQEALLLENQLIKKYHPKYNINLRDDKSYPLIKITLAEDFPRLYITRDKIKDQSIYYGPYPTIGSTKQLQRTILEVFPIRDCKKNITLSKRTSKCIKFDIGKCLGPCINPKVKAEYDSLICELQLFLKGKKRELIARLEQEMLSFSKEQKYEKAAKIRDQIEKLQKLIQKQTVALNQQKNIHIWAEVEDPHYFYLLVQKYLNGMLLTQKGYYLEKGENFTQVDFFNNIIISEYTTDFNQADELICSAKIASICMNINDLINSKLIKKIITPQFGIKKQIHELAYKNAIIAIRRLSLQSVLKYEQNLDEILKKMQNLFNLKNKPINIIGFDISHYYGTNIMASAVSFKNGLRAKTDYRIFNIQTVLDKKSDDPKSIKEAVTRYLKLCLNQQKNFPDLLLIDGGIAQLNAALDAVLAIPANLKFPDIISLAKREERIYYDKGKSNKVLDPANFVLKLLQQVRDEAHRFAVTNQRRSRKQIFESILLQVPGIGKQRLNLLYKKFKTLDNLQNMPVQEVASVGRIENKTAEHLLCYLRKK